MCTAKIIVYKTIDKHKIQIEDLLKLIFLCRFLYVGCEVLENIMSAMRIVRVLDIS